MNLEKLQECVYKGNDKELVNRISRASETLRDIRPYWHSQRCQLEAIVHQINSPHLFFKWSAVDIQ